ncbi:hypothetical protein GUJ93_ZPchr0010g10533 [Zizania palustris]|uniref:Uncharacterized protein n=1 Tax=Zizania palustris TaxID=103762 RepID=A0A8J5WHD1_ZIZPA|nr:hypothetical protein GUJ93_ZPchr0010g10533 [Zizania palustris]
MDGGHRFNVLAPRFVDQLQYSLTTYPPRSLSEAHRHVLLNEGSLVKKSKSMPNWILGTKVRSLAAGPQASQNSGKNGGGFVNPPNEFNPFSLQGLFSGVKLGVLHHQLHVALL